MTEAVLTYFRGRGRAETTRWMLAATGVPFTNQAIETPQALADLRATGKLPFDQMPLLELDGNNLSQSSAIVRYLARRRNLYGSNDADAMWCDMVAGVVADFAETAMQAPFRPSAQLAKAEMQARFDKFGPCFEARMTTQGSGYIAANQMTFADVLLAQAINGYLEWLPDLLVDSPQLNGLYQQIVSMPQIQTYLGSPLRYPKPGDEYVLSAARVLRRALPPHMPDADRFVVQ